jgi:hypothetical protein
MTQGASKVRIGRKRANDRLALHLSINGRTCRTDRRINVEAKTAGDKAKHCKTCWTPARIALAQKAIDAMTKCTRPNYPLADRLQRLLSAAIAALRTSAEQVAHEALIARFTTPVTPIVKPTFASIAASYGGRTNAPHYEHAARRLARHNLAKVA